MCPGVAVDTLAGNFPGVGTSEASLFMRKKRSELSRWLSGESGKTRKNGYGDGKREKRGPRRGGYRS